jgi:hypothetical protein
MASRFAKKPDPSIKKNVLRARAAARGAKSAHASVVAVSIAATIFASLMFANQDAQALQAAEAARASQAATTITAPANQETPAASDPQAPGTLLLAQPSR